MGLGDTKGDTSARQLFASTTRSFRAPASCIPPTPAIDAACVLGQGAELGVAADHGRAALGQ